MSKMTLRTEGDTLVIVTRHFAAPPEALYRAHTNPALIQKWMLGPEGWTMPVSISEPKPGGKIRYEWANGKGQGFYLTGEYLELEPYSRIVHVERMHLPDQTPDNHIETTFEANGTGTLMTMRMTLPNAETGRPCSQAAWKRAWKPATGGWKRCSKTPCGAPTAVLSRAWRERHKI
jgi:uncharacterized protein YndB with AHSA1/START domain